MQNVLELAITIEAILTQQNWTGNVYIFVKRSVLTSLVG